MFSISMRKPVFKKKEVGEKKRRRREMGSFCSRWWNGDKDKDESLSGSNMDCLSQCLSFNTSDEVSFDRKYERLEQRLSTLEHRTNTTEEANQRLYNKWNTIDERFQQLENNFQGDIKACMIRCRAIEQRVDTWSFDHCERLDDGIIVVNEL